MELARITLAGSDALRGRVNDLQFSADGTRFAAAVQQNPDANEDAFPQPTVAYVWDLRAPSSAPQRIPLDEYFQGLALSPDGRTIYTAWPLTAYDIASGRMVWRRDDVHAFLSLDINPAGTLLAMELHDGVKNNKILMVDARSGKTVHLLVGDQEMPRALRFSHDGTLLAAASNGGQITIWNVRTGHVSSRWKTFEQSWSVGFSADDSRVYTGGNDGMLRTWDLTSQDTYLRRTATVVGARVFSHADVSPDGRRVAFRWPQGQGGKGWIRIADTLTGTTTPRQPLPVLDGPWTPGVWRPDGRQYATHPGCNEPSVCDGAVVTLVDARTGESRTRRRLVGPHTIFSMTYVDEGLGILVGDSDGKTTVLDAHTLRPRGDSLDIHADCCATPVAKGRTAVLYQDSEDGASERWRHGEVASGKVLKAGNLKIHTFASTASPDGRWVAVSGLPGELVAIELATGRQVHGSTGVRAEVRWLRYSDDGTRLVSGASDGEISLWDAKNSGCSDRSPRHTRGPPYRRPQSSSAAATTSRSRRTTVTSTAGTRTPNAPSTSPATWPDAT
jgi:WD40 repeat protein